MKIPRSHPRYESLKTRDKIVEGVNKGITSLQGLTAHGRGEAFDYLLGEKTSKPAMLSIEAAAHLLLNAKHPVISVNGNTAALVSRDFVQLSNTLNAPLEINIFHSSKKREIKIRDELQNNGAKRILMPQKACTLKHLKSNRRFVNKDGIYKADVVFVPLEDGDRTEALIKNGMKVIVVDLNPLSRSAQKATITIVDNIIRAVPLLVETIKKMKQKKITPTSQKFDNKKNLQESLQIMLTRLR